MKHYLVIYKTDFLKGSSRHACESKLFSFTEQIDFKDCYDSILKDLNPIDFENKIHIGEERTPEGMYSEYEVYYNIILDIKRVE